MSEPVEVTQRGIRWRRDEQGVTSWYDDGASRWVVWRPGLDAPPRPRGWDRRFGGVARPGFRTPWRLVPILVVALAVVIGVVQALRPAGNAVAKEKAASAALLGKCLAQNGTLAGHPKYSTSTVPCTSSRAAVRVVRVIPSTPGSPLCPAGTVGVELPYAGVTYPHVECVEPVGN